MPYRLAFGKFVSKNYVDLEKRRERIVISVGIPSRQNLLTLSYRSSSWITVSVRDRPAITFTVPHRCRSYTRHLFSRDGSQKSLAVLRALSWTLRRSLALRLKLYVCGTVGGLSGHRLFNVGFTLMRIVSLVHRVPRSEIIYRLSYSSH